jgi:hypothetical protein
VKTLMKIMTDLHMESQCRLKFNLTVAERTGNNMKDGQTCKIKETE